MAVLVDQVVLDVIANHERGNLPEFQPTLHQLAELRAMPAFGHLESAQLQDLMERGELSVTEMRFTPLARKDTVLPTAVSCSCVPAASGPELYVLPSCAQPPPDRLNSISTGLPLFQ